MLYAIAAVIALILDQAVKYWTTANLVLNTGEKTLIPGLIHLTNIHNDGAAFSILRGQRWFFVILCVVFVAAVIYLLVKNHIKSEPARWAAVITAAGAVGNCLDRVINGYVVDMLELEFPIFGRPFPVFNIADIFITVGGILFCIFFLLEPSEDQEKSEKTEKTVKMPKPKRKKFVLPDFPVREPAEEKPLDPNDPFAEWERIAAAKPAEEKAEMPAQPAEETPAEPQPAEEAVPVESQPAVIHEQQLSSAAEPVAHAEAAEKPAETGENTGEKPAKAGEEAGAKPAKAEENDEFSFDLDDILAEFRDL